MTMTPIRLALAVTYVAAFVVVCMDLFVWRAA
jgi:hypothetical protein